MVVPATTTNSATIIRKNQRHLLDIVWNHMSGEGCRSKTEAFVKWIEWYKDRYNPTAYSVIAGRLAGGDGLIYTSDIRKYLHSLGLVDDRRLDNYRFSYYAEGSHDEMTGPMGLYMALLSRDGQKLYNSLKKGKNPVAKKKTVRKKVPAPFGL